MDSFTSEMAFEKQQDLNEPLIDNTNHLYEASSSSHVSNSDKNGPSEPVVKRKRLRQSKLFEEYSLSELKNRSSVSDIAKFNPFDTFET